ncbi:hypothetical protein XENTR_v10009844 [Xenopus tropicalis]|nr:hypothetical protein XENTR_v10009844 [Xenopus tropicalis]
MAKQREMQVMESGYSNVLGKVPSSGRHQCSPRMLVFILMGQNIALFLLLTIMAAFLFIMYFRTVEGEKNTSLNHYGTSFCL